MSQPTCPFCTPAPDQLIATGDLALALHDRYPVTRGHTLIITRRHISRLADATSDERTALFALLDEIQSHLIHQRHPDGFNIGINEGSAAGQTVDHLHIHLIPRYAGDVSDPTGGVRGVIPSQANYRRGDDIHDPASLTPPHGAALISGDDDALLPHLLAHIDLARHVDIAVAFTMVSGLQLIEPHLRDLLERGGRLRFLTGDYLDATEPRALRRLLDLAESYPDPVQLRAFEASQQGFHPKAYLFHARDAEGVALVGSSNLSRVGLVAGIEWNYRVVTGRDAEGFGHVLDAFERLFDHAATRALTEKWISSYEARRRRPVAHEVPEEIPEPPPDPHPIQQQALEALRQTREAGNKSGLVVLATGLGKTWLSAFDSMGYDRVLFIAHREEILDQALRTFRRIRPNARLGQFTGKRKDADADVLFASVQTLSRRAHLRQFAADHFDYIVMDEFHHAAAQTYRRLIDHFDPAFFLGLTATPERTDGGDLLSLCDENLVFRRDIPDGIEEGLLCPFHYYGVPDEVDYTNIPWRSTRFDEEALTQALATQARAANALDQYRTRGGERTLAFCCSQRHADFMSQYFREAGVDAVAVHAGESSAPRAASLQRLRDGELEVIFSVDMFNEGVDLPDVDTILMLRPTESKILWLQQFGRGLRQPEGVDKTLKVVDYIGNHRVFLNKPEALLQALFSMGPGLEPVRKQLELVRSGTAELPPGCEITYETEAIDLLRQLFPQRPDRGQFFYEDFRDDHGKRPLATETYHAGYNPRTLGQGNGGWVHFVGAMGDLSGRHRLVLMQRTGRFLTLLDSTAMSKSYKMVLLLAMLRRDALPGKISIDELTDAFATVASRNQVLRDDVTVNLDDRTALRRLLIENPIRAWTGAQGPANDAFFDYEDGVFRCNLEIPDEQREAFRELARELVEWRLAAYLDRARRTDRIVCKVFQAGGRPIIKLPDKQPGIPQGKTAVSVNGAPHEADFVKIAVNVLRRDGSEDNVLADVLRGWFGEEAGQPGTTHMVVFARQEEGYRLEPLMAASIGPELWKSYMRKEIPPLFGLEFAQGAWHQGFIRKDDHIFLLVTVEKGGLPEGAQYEDRFLSPEEFQWQSQNQTARHSTAGRAIQLHEAEGTQVHLFVRPTKLLNGKAGPFHYCGELNFQRWEGNKPITVWWRLQSGVPSSLHTLLRIDYPAT